MKILIFKSDINKVQVTSHKNTRRHKLYAKAQKRLIAKNFNIMNFRNPKFQAQTQK